MYWEETNRSPSIFCSWFLGRWRYLFSDRWYWFIFGGLIVWYSRYFRCNSISFPWKSLTKFINRSFIDMFACIHVYIYIFFSPSTSSMWVGICSIHWFGYDFVLFFFVFRNLALFCVVVVVVNDDDDVCVFEVLDHPINVCCFSHSSSAAAE